MKPSQQEKREAHMMRRYREHRSLRKTADEFGSSKSTVHRIVQKHNNQDNEASYAAD